MPLPVLDKESYQYSSSEYLLQAGQALKEAGYLDAEPTGTYDEEFAAALAAFQSDKNITEENEVGPQTWSALGITESQEDYAEAEQSYDVGQLSEDGLWEWDGTQWVEAGTAQSVDQSSIQVGQLSEDGQWEWDGTQWVAAGSGQSTEIEAGQLSEDGQWEWNGAEWVAAGSGQSVDPKTGPAPTAAADPGLEVFTGDKRYIIFPDEVRSGGTISWRARNPGNIRSGEKYGAYAGKKANTSGAGSFAVFPDEQTGFEAIKTVLKGYGNISVVKAMNKYAPAGDGANDPDTYARSVAKAMGVSTDTSVQDLDDSQMETFAEAVKKVEGWKEGTVWSLTDEKLPDAVKKAIRGD